MEILWIHAVEGKRCFRCNERIKSVVIGVLCGTAQRLDLRWLESITQWLEKNSNVQIKFVVWMITARYTLRQRVKRARAPLMIHNHARKLCCLELFDRYIIPENGLRKRRDAAQRIAKRNHPEAQFHQPAHSIFRFRFKRMIYCNPFIPNHFPPNLNHSEIILINFIFIFKHTCCAVWNIQYVPLTAYSEQHRHPQRTRQ